MRDYRLGVGIKILKTCQPSLYNRTWGQSSRKWARLEWSNGGSSSTATTLQSSNRTLTFHDTRPLSIYIGPPTLSPIHSMTSVSSDGPTNATPTPPADAPDSRVDSGTGSSPLLRWRNSDNFPMMDAPSPLRQGRKSSVCANLVRRGELNLGSEG